MGSWSCVRSRQKKYLKCYHPHYPMYFIPILRKWNSVHLFATNMRMFLRIISCDIRIISCIFEPRTKTSEILMKSAKRDARTKKKCIKKNTIIHHHHYQNILNPNHLKEFKYNNNEPNWQEYNFDFWHCVAHDNLLLIFVCRCWVFTLLDGSHLCEYIHKSLSLCGSVFIRWYYYTYSEQFV